MKLVMTKSKTMSATAIFEIGQILHHRMFDYRGVVLDVDPNFQGGEEWYEKMAHSHPPKDQPWYHMLVDNSSNPTYVAERNLEPAEDIGPINHYLLDQGLMRYKYGRYLIERRLI